MKHILKGFSLMEVMVAMVIASLVVTAGTASVIAIMKSTKATTQRSSIDEESKMLMDYLVTRTQTVGGGSVRPWNGLWVENNCAARNGLPDCNGSDRLSVVMPDLDNECLVTNGAVSPADTLTIDSSLGTCCIDATFENKAAILVKDDGRSFRQVWLDNFNPGSCTIDYDQGSSQLSTFGVDPGDWNNAALYLAQVTTYFLDETNLRIYRDSDGDGTYEPNLLDSTTGVPLETGELMVDIYDLQFALGLDNNPEDGNIIDTDSNSDEWTYNAAGEVYDVTTDGSSLRFLSIGFMIGVPVRDQPPNQLRIFDGPVRTQYQADGIYLHPATSKAYLRNLLLFF